MPVPNRVTKISKNGITFESSVERTQYTIQELKRAALRDVGIFIIYEFKKAFYGAFSRRRGKDRAIQYWARFREGDLQVGWKSLIGFHHGFQETAGGNLAQKQILRETVYKNIPKIIEIESKYLSSLQDEAAALAKISEQEYEGGDSG